MADSESRPATWMDPETGQFWVLPRRYVPEHFVRVDENEVRDE
jgi:hypothetical protein